MMTLKQSTIKEPAPDHVPELAAVLKDQTEKKPSKKSALHPESVAEELKRIERTQYVRKFKKALENAFYFTTENDTSGGIKPKGITYLTLQTLIYGNIRENLYFLIEKAYCYGYKKGFEAGEKEGKHNDF